MMTLFEAFLIGLAGSLHCAGMCGPIAIALPVKQSSWGARIAGTLVYNSGRILTYAVLGFILGLAGMGLFLWGVQRWVSILAGLFMVVWALGTFFAFSGNGSGLFRNGIPGLKKVFGERFNRQSYGSVLVIGLLNGILPCGLVYIALAGAVLSTSPLGGALYMLVFGLGTVPVLTAVTLGGAMIGGRFRETARKAVPYFVLLIGILFILRGLNLGIPYISPKMESPREVPACCHGK